ncbi:MAG: TonB-dependent receptor [Neisseriaceae bacterium]
MKITKKLSLKPLTIWMLYFSAVSTLAAPFKTMNAATKSAHLQLAENLSTQNKESPVYTLNPVVVTGYGFSNFVYDIPGSVDVVRSDQINATNLRTLEELKGKVSGLTFQNNGSAADSYIFIRGVGDFIDEFGKSTQVSIDGMPLVNTEMKNILLQNEVESIEILKGPQNVLYGPYAKAGAINIKTKVPKKTGGTLGLSMGNDVQRGAYFNYNYVFNPYFTISTSFNLDADKGWLTSYPAGKKYGGRNFRDYSFKAFITPSDATSIIFRYLRGNRRLKGPIMVSYSPLEDKFYSYRLPTPPNPWTPRIGKELPYYHFGTVADPITLSKSNLFGLELLHHFDQHVALEARTSYSEQNRYRVTDATTSSLELNPDRAVLTSTDTIFQRSFFQDLRLKAEYEKYKWILGASVHKTTNNVDRINLLLVNTGFKGKDYSSGFYSQLQWLPIPSFEFSVGARYQKDRIKYTGKLGKDSVLNNGLAAAFGVNRKNSVPSTPDSVLDHTFVYSGTATWKINPYNHLYYTHATSYKPGGYSSGYFPGTYAKETARTNEIGYKGRFSDDKVYLSAALFDTNFQDMQQFNPVTYVISNIARVSFKGYELQGKLTITPQWNIGLNYTRVSTRIKSFKGGTTPVGKSHPYFPHYTGNIFSSYEKKLSQGNLRWYAELNFWGNQYIDFYNRLKLKPIQLVNTSVTWQHKQHEVKLWVNNLLNKKYLASAYSTGGHEGAAFGRGRTFGINYRYSF